VISILPAQYYIVTQVTLLVKNDNQLKQGPVKINFYYHYVKILNMRLIICCLAIVLTVGCASTSRVLDNDLKVAEITNGQETSQSNVGVYLNNEGTDRVSIRFKTQYLSAPKKIHRLYIFNEDVPELKRVIGHVQNNTLSLEDMIKPFNFGRDKGMVRQMKTKSGNYLTITTIEGAYKFPVSSLPSLLAILAELK
jgi:hypothetical protein